MPAHRRPALPYSAAPRGTCRWCGESILYEAGNKGGQLDRRRRWHPVCVDTYMESDPREARTRRWGAPAFDPYCHIARRHRSGTVGRSCGASYPDAVTLRLQLDGALGAETLEQL